LQNFLNAPRSVSIFFKFS